MIQISSRGIRHGRIISSGASKGYLTLVEMFYIEYQFCPEASTMVEFFPPPVSKGYLTLAELFKI